MLCDAVPLLSSRHIKMASEYLEQYDRALLKASWVTGTSGTGSFTLRFMSRRTDRCRLGSCGI